MAALLELSLSTRHSVQASVYKNAPSSTIDEGSELMVRVSHGVGSTSDLRTVAHMACFTCHDSLDVVWGGLVTRLLEGFLQFGVG